MMMMFVHLVTVAGVVLRVKTQTTLQDLKPSFSLVNPNTTFHQLEPLPIGRKIMDYLKENVFQNIFATTLQQVIEGPLNGKAITLLFDDDTERDISVNKLLAGVKQPLSLLRSKNIYGTIYNELGNSTEANETSVFIKELEEEDNSTMEILDGNVLVYVTAEKQTETLLSPPTSWSLAGLLLISLHENCNIDFMVQTPLALQTSSLSVMCPVFQKSHTDGFGTQLFRVFTWRVFHPHQNLLPLGAWSSSSFPNWKDLFVDRFHSFYGTTLHMTSDDGEMPYFFLKPDGTIDGVNKRMVDAIANWMNFNYTYTQLADDGKWGELVNGTWVGMLGQIWRGEKDFTVNGFSIIEERTKYFDFSVPYQYKGFGFKIKVPQPLPRWLSISYPFTTTIWGVLALTLLITTVAFYLLQYNQHRLSPVEAFLIIIKSLMNQGVTLTPKSWILKWFLSMWWFTSFIIVIIYNCNLISFFTVPVYPPRIQTVQQLAQSDYRLCMVDYGEFVPEALATSSHPQLSILGSKLDLVPQKLELELFGFEQCVELAIEDNYVHLEFTPFLDSIYNKMGESDSVYSLNEEIYEAHLAFFFRKHTPWKYKFDLAISRLVEAGVVEKWNAEVMNDLKKMYAKKRADESSGEQALALAHLQGPFFILTFGLLSGTAVFLIEYFSGHPKPLSNIKYI